MNKNVSWSKLNPSIDLSLVGRVITGLIVFLFITVSYAEDPDILHIRNEYQAIRNALPELKTETVDLSGHSTEGGDAEAFIGKNGEVRLIKTGLFFESGKFFEEFYYENESLIFALYSEHRYNVPFYVTPEIAKDIGGEAFNPDKTAIKEYRYYFNNGEMIRWLDENKNPVSPHSRDFKDAEKMVLNRSNKIFLLFK